MPALCIQNSQIVISDNTVLSQSYLFFLFYDFAEIWHGSIFMGLVLKRITTGVTSGGVCGAIATFPSCYVMYRLPLKAETDFSP